MLRSERFSFNSHGLRLPEPYLQISTGERQLAHQVISELYGCRFREYGAALQSGVKPTRVHRVDFGALTLSMLSYGRDLIIEPGDFGNSLLISTILQGEFKVFAGGFIHGGGVGTTALTAAADRPRFRYDGNAQVLKLRADQRRLEACCWQLLGQKGREALRFRVPMDDEGFLQRWLALLVFMVGSLDSGAGGRACKRLEASLEESVLMTLLARQPHNYSEQLSGAGQSIAPRQWRRAVAFMEANIREPVTLTEIAGAAGCSVRSLTRAFREFKETTPMRHLLELRLAHVHAELCASDAPPRAITLIALHWGFRHLGEFNRHYHERFGETPSQTRKRFND